MRPPPLPGARARGRASLVMDTGSLVLDACDELGNSFRESRDEPASVAPMLKLKLVPRLSRT